MYLLDTNVLSELRKIPSRKANQGVVNWYNSVDKDTLFLNAIVVLEQRKWVLSKNRKDKRQGEILQKWLDYVLHKFDGKILPITTEIALICAELHVPDERDKHDALIASTASLFTLDTKSSSVYSLEFILSISS